MAGLRLMKDLSPDGVINPALRRIAKAQNIDMIAA
jgi:hypothetical protein